MRNRNRKANDEYVVVHDEKTTPEKIVYDVSNAIDPQ